MKTFIICFILGWLLAGDPAWGHDIYQKLRGHDGMPCCGGQECAPVEAIPVNANWHRYFYNNQGLKMRASGPGYYLPASGEFIPIDWAAPSPDDRFHRCT